MAADNAQQLKCEFCKKEGLAVLPIRYAIVEGDSPLPEPSTPNAAEATPVDLPANEGTPLAKYITRPLRSGFLYTYDEARDHWDAYYVAPKSYYFKLDLSQPTPDLEELEFSCERTGHSALASCITIPDPANATKVWFGFSDVEWTPAILERNKTLEERIKHMRCLNVNTWLGTQEHPHAAPMDTVDEVVSEYTPQAFSTRRNGFAWSNAPLVLRHHGTTRHLKRAARRLSGSHALAFAVDDPTAIAQDLTGLMQYHWDTFVEERMAEQDFARGLVISSVIEQAKTGIQSQAVTEYVEDHEIAVQNLRMVTDGQGPTFTAPGTGIFELAGASRRIRPMTADTIDEVATKAWKPYTEKYNEAQRLNWQQEAHDKFAAYEQKVITPLALAHTQWMQSDLMAASFNGNFDENDIDNGVAYSALFTQCVAGTQDKKPSFDLYSNWLQGDVDDPNNLLLRACVYNYQPIAQAVQADTQGLVTWGDIPWDKLIQIWSNSTTQMNTAQANVLGHLLAHVNGPVAKLVNAAASSSVIYPGLAALGVVNGQPMVKIEFTGTRSQLRNHLNARLAQLSGSPMKHRHTRAELIAQKSRLQAGAQVSHRATIKWIIMADSEAFENMPQNLGPSARANWVVSNIHNVDDAKKIQAGYWRRNVQNAGIANGVGLFGLGILGGILDYRQLQSFLQEDVKAMRHASPEIKARIAAQGTQLAGSVGDIFGRGMQGVGKMRFAGSNSAFLITFGDKLSRTAGTVSMIGGLLMAVVDFWRGFKELSEGNVGAGGGYITMSLLGIGVVYLIAASAYLTAGLVLIVLLVASLIVQRIVDNPLEDWLQRVFLWGEFDEDDRYENLGVEIREFNKATGATINPQTRLRDLEQSLKAAG